MSRTKNAPPPCQNHPLPLVFTVYGRVVTKKNHRKLFVLNGQARMGPAAAWEQWCERDFNREAKHCANPSGPGGSWSWGLRAIKKRPRRFRGVLVAQAPKLIPAFVPCLTLDRVHVKVIYSPPDRRWMPDLLGMEEAVADALERCQIVSNDRQIQSWDGSRIRDPDPDGKGWMSVRVFKMSEEP